MLLLAGAAELDGGVQVTGHGPVAEGMRAVIETLNRDLQEARRQLRESDERTAVSREHHRKEYEND